MTLLSPVGGSVLLYLSLPLVVAAHIGWGSLRSDWFHSNSVCWMNETPPFSFLDITSGTWNIPVLDIFIMTFLGLEKVG